MRTNQFSCKNLKGCNFIQDAAEEPILPGRT